MVVHARIKATATTLSSSSNFKNVCSPTSSAPLQRHILSLHLMRRSRRRRSRSSLHLRLWRTQSLFSNLLENLLPSIPDSSGKDLPPPIPLQLTARCEDVDCNELAELIVACTPASQRPSMQPPDPARLAKALQHSTVICAAHARTSDIRAYLDETLKDEEEEDDEDDAHSDYATTLARWLDGTGTILGDDRDSDGDNASEWRLVGFSRAISDTSLVGIMHDTAVVPALASSSVASDVIAEVVNTLTHEYDISDIGVAVAEHHILYPSFKACLFDLDEEETFVMRFDEKN